MLDWIYDTSKRYPRIVGACVCAIFFIVWHVWEGENMPQRIDDVLKSKGYWANY